MAVTGLPDKMISALLSITEEKTKQFITADTPMTELSESGEAHPVI